MDGPPDDKEGFFGHPLTRAEIAINGEAQQDAQREAFLHEYMNLQSWNRSGIRIRDFFNQTVTVAAGPSGAGGSGAGGGEGTGDGVASSSPVVVSDRPLPMGEESGHGDDTQKENPVESTNASEYFVLLDAPSSELNKFHHFGHILNGEPQDACPEVVVPFEDSQVDVDVMRSAPLAKVKAEATRATNRTNTLHEKATHVKGATRRSSQQDQGLPQRVLRRSESEPCTTLTERVLGLGERYPALAESSFEDPFSTESLVRGCEDVAGASMNGDRRQESEDSAMETLGCSLPPTPSECDTNGMNDSLTMTASVVSSSGLLPPGHCVISSSSEPTLRLSPTSNLTPDSAPASAKPSNARGKGRGAKGGQSRARGGHKEGARTKNKRHSTTTVPTIITSTSTASPLSSSASSTHVTPSCTIPPLTVTSPASSPAVLSSTLPPEGAVSVTEIPDVLTSGVSVSSAGLPASPSASPSVLLLPLAHSTLLAVDPETPALVVPQQASHPGSSAVVHQRPDSAEPVKQTTKDKLKLRIAQTAMTQPLEQQQQQQQQQQHQHQHHMVNGHKGIQQLADAHQMPYNHPYQLHHHHQLQQHQQQQQQSHLKVQQHQTSSEVPPTYMREEELASLNMDGKFSDVLPAIKQEDQFLEYEPHYPPPYSSEEALQVLYNSVPMATSNAVTCEGHDSFVSMTTVNDSDTQTVLSETEIFSQMSSAESLLVQPQFLHLLQPVNMGQPPQQHPHQHQPQHHHHQHHHQQQQQTRSNGYFNANDNLYIYTTIPEDNASGKMEEHLLDLDSEKNALQYVQHQQQQQQQQQQPQPLADHYGYGGSGYQHQQQYVSVGNVDTSPDSGIGQDPGLSPTVAVMTLKDTGGDGTARKEGKSLKRRKSSSQNPVLQRQCSSGSDKVSPRNSAIQKLEMNTTGYQYYLDTPTSTTQRIEEDRVTYLNKSQYYPLILENTRPECVPKGVMCKSVIMLVFREEKSSEEESKAWQFWHSRQHSYKQRILDIDTKNSQGVGPSSIGELAFNAVSVKWNPREGPVRVNIAVHCLSTDFSNQKGVKGIPLHIQCDTYELFNSNKELLPSHRGFCQIKVFCDKGAERKTRDEERRRNAKASKATEPTSCSPGRKRSEEVFHPLCDRSEFYSLADLSTSPVYFNPSYGSGDCHRQPEHTTPKEEDNSSQPSSCQSGDVLEESTPAKMTRLTSCASCNKLLTPLLYVKESHDKAYHAIHLELPTVDELLKAISYKFNKQLRNVTNFFKRSKNGMLVRMDDDIIRRYTHETAFLLEIHHEGREDMEVILLETSH